MLPLPPTPPVYLHRWRTHTHTYAGTNQRSPRMRLRPFSGQPRQRETGALVSQAGGFAMSRSYAVVTPGGSVFVLFFKSVLLLLAEHAAHYFAILFLYTSRTRMRHFSLFLFFFFKKMVEYRLHFVPIFFFIFHPIPDGKPVKNIEVWKHL